jgi:hypothetical protein
MHKREVKKSGESRGNEMKTPKETTTKKEAEETKLRLLSDEPISGLPEEKQDGLNFDIYAHVLAKAAADTPGPFTIGVFGEWGTGKTSLMKMIKRNLDEDFPKEVITVWFNAWRYEKETHPIVPLIATIIQQLERKRTLLDQLGEDGKKLIRGLRAVAYGFSSKAKIQMPGFAEIEAGFVAKDMIDREEKLTPDPLLERSLYYEAFETLEKVSQNKFKIVVIVDDLDRCFPDRAIELLESIKLVLAQPGFVFILGVARNVIEGYLKHRYEKEYGLSSFDGGDYLDKIVQLPFFIPPHTGRVEQFSAKLISQFRDEDRDAFAAVLPIVGDASGSNPRSIIRFVNNLLIDREIYQRLTIRTVETPLFYFAISRALQQRWPKIFNLLSTDNELCTNLWLGHQEKLKELEGTDKANYDNFWKLVDEKDKNLRDLLFVYGMDWLKNAEDRNETTQFILLNRPNDEQLKPPKETKELILINLQEELKLQETVLQDLQAKELQIKKLILIEEQEKRPSTALNKNLLELQNEIAMRFQYKELIELEIKTEKAVYFKNLSERDITILDNK